MPSSQQDQENKPYVTLLPGLSRGGGRSVVAVMVYSRDDEYVTSRTRACKSEKAAVKLAQEWATQMKLTIRI